MNTASNIVLGSKECGADLAYDPTFLRTHCSVLAMTGAGKTGVVLGMAEELVRNGVPVVLLDIKGDMANLFLQDGELKDLMAPRLITPGANHGESINLVSGLTSAEGIAEAVTSILDLVALDSDPIECRHVFLTEVLKARHKKSQRCQLEDIVMAIQHPAFGSIGAMVLDDVISLKLRKELAAKLNNVMVADVFEHWRHGITLDIGEMLKATDDGRTPVIVYSIAHITNKQQRQFAITLLVQEMVTYMRKCRGTDDLRTAFIVDECAGLMTPSGGGPIKEGLLTLLQQGRSTGIGMILSTQNPMQLDYKAMSSCGTWIIGRLTTDNDRKRLVAGVCSASGISKKELTAQIGGLQPREFLSARGDDLVHFKSRRVSCDLVGPMNAEDLLAMFPKPVEEPQSFGSRALSFLRGGKAA